MAQGYVYSGSPASLAARSNAAPLRLPAAGIRYYTTIGQAKGALGGAGSDEPGLGVRFAAGKGYYLGAAPKGATAGASPAAPSSDTATATAAIQAILKPVIDQITTAERNRAAQGQQLITGYTNNATDQLKGLDFGAPYKAAEGDQNAVNTALLARLGNQGSALQNQLQGELGTSVGAPAAGAVVGRVGADTNGAQNAGLAKGDATLSSLISQGAAAKTYGMKLPGIETLAGLQDSAKLQGAVNTDQQNQLASIEAKVPSMVQSELGALANARTAQQKNEIAALIADGRVKEALQVAKMNNDTRTSIANANNTTRENIAASNQQIAQAQDSVKNRLSFARTFGYDPVTGKLAAGYVINGQGHVVKASTAKGAPKLTAAQTDKYSGLAATIASNGHDGFTDAKGMKHPPITWQQALVEMDKEGIPKPIQLQKIAQFYQVNVGTPATSFPTLTQTAGK